jgi:pimeloyl-ACP methyl ester carboxylesterase
MMRVAIVLLAILGVLAAALLLTRTPDTDPAEMQAKYGGENARFAGIANGLRIHYRDEGAPDGPVLVLIHGSSASLHTWEPLVERLSGRYRIISYDQPGHGLTGPHPRDDYSANAMLEALDAVVAAAGVERFSLAGNSMGGWVAWRYALAHPGRIEAMILINSAGAPLREGETAPPLNLGFRLQQKKWLRPLLREVTPRRLVKASLEGTVVDRAIVTEEMVDRYWELIRYPGNRRASGFRVDVDREPAIFDRISEITAPTLILWGAEDRLIYASAARTFDERLPFSRAIVYENIGHLPMEETPDRVALDIGDFLDEALADRRAP